LTFLARSDKISQKKEKSGKKSRSFPKTPGFAPVSSPNSSKNRIFWLPFWLAPLPQQCPRDCQALIAQTDAQKTRPFGLMRESKKPPTTKG
jgi:hypothetical protein